MNFTSNKYKILFLFFVVFFISVLNAQNRGNNLSYQGFDNINSFSAKSLGMGGAFTSIGGTIDVLNFNPAGLATINKLQISIGSSQVSRKWTENQIYNQNRTFCTLPFYLEKLFIPDPINNGKLDSEVFFDGLIDSSYLVSLPDTGLESFSDDAADWINKENASGPINLLIALPFTLLDKKIVIGASYNKRIDVFNYDRNETYLNPHPGYSEYNMPPKIEDGMDTITINWSDFIRKRNGSIQEFQGAFGVDLTEIIKLGFSFKYFSGETKDQQDINKIGFFNLIDQNEFTFSYDTLNVLKKGKSTFSGLKSELGFQLMFDAFSFGMNLRMPYTVNRDYKYDITTIDTINTINSTEKGKDEMKIPFSYAIGVNFHPNEKFTFSLDYDLRRYENTDWNLAEKDTTHRDWVDQNILRFGIQYSPIQLLDLRIGYRTIPQVFVPDGAAFRNKGPEARAYTLGMGLNFGNFGSLNAAWEYRKLKYYDQYFSNTNYCKEEITNIIIGYTYNF